VIVVARGDINVSGASVAAFNGGNVFVESLGGNVNTGSGNLGEILVNEVVVDPTTGAVTTPQQPIEGGGIVAMTFPDAPSTLPVGNIQVLAAQNISTGCGGIAQYSWNGTSQGSPTLFLQAGGNILTSPGCSTTGSGPVVACLVTAGGNPFASVFPNATCQTVFVFNTNGQPETLIYPNNLNVADQTIVAGANVNLTATVTGSSPMAFQWYKNGASLPSATNADLNLTNVRRSDAGTYTVTVSIASDSFIFATELYVLVPQLVNPPLLQPDGTVFVSFGDYDGGILGAQDSGSFVVQASPDLVNWVTLPDAIVPAGNGQLGFFDDLTTIPPPVFFRVLEQ
jgi:hypothetical protein